MHISEDEFVQAAHELLQHAYAFNIAHQCHEIDIRLIRTPSNAYSSTASCFLRLADVHDIIYQPSFQLPTLYNTRCGDEVLDDQQKFGSDAMWSYTEHPISGLPCLFLHPCNTATIMSELLSSGSRPLFLLSWMGIYNQIANLNLPLEFFAVKAFN